MKMDFEAIKDTLPGYFRQEIADYDWEEILTGHSSSSVFRLKSLTEETIYLKISPNDSIPSLWQEKKRLHWLAEKLPVPQSLMFMMDESNSYFLLSEIKGYAASHHSLKKDTRQVIEQLAEGLKMIHSLPAENCPFDARLDHKIRLARKMMENDLVDESDFDGDRRGRTAADLFCELVESKPDGEDLVFTHGDYCLPNIIIENGKISGFVDWGSAGVADRYQDIALLARSVEYNFGAEWKEVLFESLDLEPDLQKVHFYALLDEFF